LSWTTPVTETVRPFRRSLQAVAVNAVTLFVVTVFELTVNETDGHFPDSADIVPLNCVVDGGAGGGGVGGGGVGVGGGGGGAEPTAP